MTKSDLRNGMRVVTRNGKTYTVFKDFYSQCKLMDVLVSHCGTWMDLNTFNEDLTNQFFEAHDIMEVKIVYHPYETFQQKCNDEKTIWTREKRKKLTISEIEQILGFKVEIIDDRKEG